MVIDSSSLISLARSGLLPLLALLPVEPVIVDVVEAESVSDGLAGGHADAAAIEATIAPFPRHTSAGTRPPDAAVLDAARQSAPWWPTTSPWAGGRATWARAGCGRPT